MMALGGCYSETHFTDKAQRSEGCCPAHTQPRGKGQSWESNPGLPGVKAHRPQALALILEETRGQARETQEYGRGEAGGGGLHICAASKSAPSVLRPDYKIEGPGDGLREGADLSPGATGEGSGRATWALLSQTSP